MIKKQLLRTDRVRKINGSFGFIPHRFLTDGFLGSLSPYELLLYFFLILVSDKNGLSFYKETTISQLLHMQTTMVTKARRALIEKELIAYDGTLFQVLELPEKPL
ncbi:MAG: hypothetical protein R6U27_14415 [Desulfobacterales bacterium]